MAVGRRSGFDEGLESPDGFGLVATEGPVVGEATGGLDDDAMFGDFFVSLGEADFFLGGFIGPRCAVFDPGFNVGDLFFIEAIVLLGRHFVVGVFPLDDSHEEGLFGVAGDEEVVDEFAAFEVAFAGEEVELAFDFIGVFAVAGDAL